MAVEFIPSNPSPEQPFVLSDKSVAELKDRFNTPAPWGVSGLGANKYIAASMPAGIEVEHVPYLVEGFKRQLGTEAVKGVIGAYRSEEENRAERVAAAASEEITV